MQGSYPHLTRVTWALVSLDDACHMANSRGRDVSSLADPEGGGTVGVGEKCGVSVSHLPSVCSGLSTEKEIGNSAKTCPSRAHLPVGKQMNRTRAQSSEIRAPPGERGAQRTPRPGLREQERLLKKEISG